MPARTLHLGRSTRTVDARPDRLDLRDRPYRPALGNLPPRLPGDAALARWMQAYREAGLVLDQGSEGACTGYGLAAVIHHLRLVAAQGAGLPTPARVSPAMLYQLARLYDEWPGTGYEGSSCRGALKGWHRHGVCRETLWPDTAAPGWDVDALDCTLGVYYRIDKNSVVDMQAALRDTGAVYASATVHEGWALQATKGAAPAGSVTRHAELPTIAHIARPKDAGVHAFALVGYDEEGFLVQNSWGPRWGAAGFARLPYEAWVAHGEDAWVFTLGVPRRALHAGAAADAGGSAGSAEPVRRSPQHWVPPAGARGAASAQALQRAPGAVGLDGRDDALQRRLRGVPGPAQPLSMDEAYGHAVVLDRGFAVHRDITAVDAAQGLERVALQRPAQWLRERGARKLLVYVHGGLNSEADSLARIRTLAPYALAQGIYPLFVTWRTGPLETLSDLVEEALAQAGETAAAGAPARGWLEQLSERTDRLLEAVLRVPGSAMWNQMKLNALRASSHPEGGARAMVAHLAALQAQLPGLELHLMGHSAGAIFIGALLEPLREAGLRAATLRLFAPACTTRFALEHYAPAVRAGTLDARHWHLHQLSDANERRDSVGPYRKSLLWLVSRAFEDEHKTPLLGLQASFDARTTGPRAADDTWSRRGAQDVAEWLDFWRSLGLDASNRHVLRGESVSTGAGFIPASHGCFDNSVDLMGRALGAVLEPGHPTRVPIHRLDD